MKACKIVLTVCVFLVILSFIFTNQKTLTTSLEFNYHDFGFQTQNVEIPVLSLLLFAFALGALLVGLKGFADQQQLKHRLRRLNRELQRRTEEVIALKERAALGTALPPDPGAEVHKAAPAGDTDELRPPAQAPGEGRS